MPQLYSFTVAQFVALLAIALTTGAILGVAAFVAINARARFNAHSWAVRDQATARPVDDRGSAARRADDQVGARRAIGGDHWELLIAAWLAAPGRPPHPTTDEVLEHALSVPAPDRGHANQARAEAIIRRLGYVKVRERLPFERFPRAFWRPADGAMSGTAVRLRGPSPSGVFTVEAPR